MPKQKATVFNPWMNDAALAEMVDVVLEYESTVRGLTRGQAAYQLVLEAARVDAYPGKLRARLDEIDSRRRARAARESLSVPRRGKVA